MPSALTAFHTLLIDKCRAQPGLAACIHVAVAGYLSCASKYFVYAYVRLLEVIFGDFFVGQIPT